MYPEKIHRFEADDLIYNRFDLIFPESFEKSVYYHERETFPVQSYVEKTTARLNLWGKKLPQQIFEEVICDTFYRHPEIRCIELKRACNNYRGFLWDSTNVFIALPETTGQLLERLRSKHRCSIKREKQHLEEQYGRFNIKIYHSPVPDDIIEQYFMWKQVTHKTNYCMSPQEYLRTYHVTDVLLLRAGEMKVGILLFCQVGSTVYLENLSYNCDLKKYSPGFLAYEMFLEELIHRKCRTLFLGGGGYAYKKRFGAIETATYSGKILKKEVFDDISLFLNNRRIKTVAAYGMGAVGRLFIRMAGVLDIKFYGIDREKKLIENIEVYSIEETWPDADAAFITISGHNREIEELLMAKFEHVFYWQDIIDSILEMKLPQELI